MRYSYSSLATWQKCPRMWEAKYVTHTWPDVPLSPALIRGQQVHEALERAVRGEGDPPMDIWLPNGLIPLLRQRAQAEVELKLDDPPMVGRLDVLMTGPTALVIDWKTGRLRPDPLQADVYAVLIRRNLGIQDVTFAWVGVDSRRVAECQPDGNAEARVRSVIEDIERARQYPPVESWACRFCPLIWCEKNRAAQVLRP